MATWNVDPDEFAEAVRDGMLTGGASPDEANVEAELGRVQAIAHNETPVAERWTLNRADPLDVEWAAANDTNDNPAGPANGVSPSPTRAVAALSDVQGRLYEDVLAAAGEHGRDSRDVLADSDAALPDKVAVADALGGPGAGTQFLADQMRRQTDELLAEEDPTPHRGPESDDWADWDDAEHRAQRAAIEAEYGAEVEAERWERPAGQVDFPTDDDCDGW